MGHVKRAQGENGVGRKAGSGSAGWYNSCMVQIMYGAERRIKITGWRFDCPKGPQERQRSVRAVWEASIMLMYDVNGTVLLRVMGFGVIALGSKGDEKTLCLKLALVGVR